MTQLFRAAVLILVATLGTSSASIAQDSPALASTPHRRGEELRPAAAPGPRLPPPAVTHHALELPGRTLRFTATAGAIVLPDAAGAPRAEIATIAYTLDGADAADRPVVFAFNGGPGFASAFVQLGGFGPWRVPMDSAPSSQPIPVPNAETWLDFADLVFVDPVETGYSRIVSGDEPARKRMLSVNGDIDYLAETIRRWLEANGRMTSPKFIAGESYGGFRAPRIARVLQSELGIGVSGLVLISPMLDSGGRSSAFDLLAAAEILPSLTAVARSGAGDVSRASLADVEAYATGDYLQDQFRVSHDPVALDRVTAKVAGFTGLDPTLVRRLRGRVDTATFLRNRQPGRIASIYDATVSAPQAEDANPWFTEPDPLTDRLIAPFTGGMLEIYRRLQWHPEGLYRLRSRDVAREWEWNRGWRPPEAVTALRVDLAVDSRMRVLVAHGLYDVATPYFASKLILDDVPEIGDPGRVRLLCLPAGHMIYAREAPRRALREAVRELVLGRPGQETGTE